MKTVNYVPLRLPADISAARVYKVLEEYLSLADIDVRERTPMDPSWLATTSIGGCGVKEAKMKTIAGWIRYQRFPWNNSTPDLNNAKLET